MNKEITIIDWIIVFSLIIASCIAISLRAEGQSVEHMMDTASSFQSWDAELRQREQLLTERNVQQQTANQQAAHVLTERIQAHNQQVQHRENSTQQQHQDTLQAQQATSAQRETDLIRQMKAQRSQSALDLLRNGMREQAVLQRLEQPQDQQDQQTIPERAYGYLDKVVSQLPGQTQLHTDALHPGLPASRVPSEQSFIPFTLVLKQPPVLPPVIPMTTQLKTTINGIDQIETRAILSEDLSVEQLGAIKNIADNGVLIVQQRFGLEQSTIATQTGVTNLSIWKSIVLWGLVLCIPFVLTVYWIGKQIAIGWHVWQHDKLEYKLKELASAERQIAMSSKTTHYNDV